MFFSRRFTIGLHYLNSGSDLLVSTKREVRFSFPSTNLLSYQSSSEEMGVGRIFSRGGAIVNFPAVPKKIFAAATKVAQFHFNHSTLRKQRFLAKNVM